MSLFKRFLDIARLLQIRTCVVTDNDGDADAVTARYADYAEVDSITICFDPDEAYPTLEPQLLKANGRAKLNSILGTAYEDEDEEKYNKRAAQECDSLACMDRKLIAHGGGSSKIEFCDLYDAGLLIHVKRYSGSSGLSHLFEQGIVSAVAFLSDADFRAKASAKASLVKLCIRSCDG